MKSIEEIRVDERDVFLTFNLILAILCVILTLLNVFIFHSNNLRYIIYGFEIEIIIKSIVSIAIAKVNIKRMKKEMAKFGYR